MSIGGRLFAGIAFQGGTGNSGPTRRFSPHFVDYVRLYPGFNDVNPFGAHFGVAMEFCTGPTFSGARQGSAAAATPLACSVARATC